MKGEAELADWPALTGEEVLAVFQANAVKGSRLPPLQVIFRTVSLNWEQWGMVLGVAALPFLGNIFYSRIKFRVKEKIVYLKV